MLFAKVASKPKFLAVWAGSSGNDDPAKAPAPSELTDVRLNQSLMRSKSLANAWACFANSWPNETG